MVKETAERSMYPASSGRIRNEGIDALRFLLMAMIVTHHCIVHGLSLFSMKDGINPGISGVFYFLNSFCVIGVNGFFWISGFHHIKLRSGKIRNMYLVCVFYALVLSIIIYASGAQALPTGPIQIGKELFYIICPLFDYWYIAAYLAISVFSPLINKGIENTSIHEDIYLLSGLIAVNTVFGFLFRFIGVGDGYTLSQGIYMYCLGTLSRKYYTQITEKIKRHWFILTYLIMTLAVGALAFTCTRFAFYKYSWRVFSYNNPLIVCSSVALCFWFSTVKSRKWMKAVSAVGANCLSAYLITDYTKVRPFIFKPALALFTGNNPVDAVIIVFYALILVVMCYLIDRCRAIAIRKLFRRKKKVSDM